MIVYSINRAGSWPAQHTDRRNQRDDLGRVVGWRQVERAVDRSRHRYHLLHRDVPVDVGSCKSWFYCTYDRRAFTSVRTLVSLFLDLYGGYGVGVQICAVLRFKLKRIDDDLVAVRLVTLRAVSSSLQQNVKCVWSRAGKH